MYAENFFLASDSLDSRTAVSSSPEQEVLISSRSEAAASTRPLAMFASKLRFSLFAFSLPFLKSNPQTLQALFFVSCFDPQLGQVTLMLLPQLGQKAVSSSASKRVQHSGQRIMLLSDSEKLVGILLL